MKFLKNFEEENISIDKIKGISTPIPIDYFSKNNIKIIKIACGGIHNLCLDNKGIIYSFGCCKAGQLGIDKRFIDSYIKYNLKYNNKNDEKFISEPQQITILKKFKIIDICCGEAHNLVLNDKGGIFVWGFTENGEIGINYKITKIDNIVNNICTTPLLNKNITNVKKVICGKTFSLVLNNNYELYSFGLNDLNQCGYVSNEINIYFPRKIEMFTRMKITEVACGESHVLAIAEECNNKIVFSWGNNRFGQLGHGNKSKCSTPKIINYFLHYNKSKVDKIVCGGYHSLVLLKKIYDINKVIDKEKDELYLIQSIDRMDNFNN